MTWGEFFAFCCFVVALVALVADLCRKDNGQKRSKPSKLPLDGLLKM